MISDNKRYVDFTGKKPSTKLVNSLVELNNLLALPPTSIKVALAAKKFPFLAPQNFINRIKPGDLNDPLLKQILPSAKELQSPINFNCDPLGEATYNPLPGLLHKYPNRALILLTNVCAINCRYCFRRAFPFCNNVIDKNSWQEILKYLQQHHDIQEVILSGGDPLTLSNQYLAQIMADLATISHLNTIRIHSRIPIVLPSRINISLIKLLTSTHLKPVLVTHCNHPNEINITVTKVFKKLAKKNITLLNQSVLLKGVNDNVETLVELSRKLFSIGILPYYLHMHDKVIGTAHFDTPTITAKKLIKTVATRLPGYLVPRLVRESLEHPFKCPIQ